jgi:hypothetical protein
MAAGATRRSPSSGGWFFAGPQKAKGRMLAALGISVPFFLWRERREVSPRAAAESACCANGARRSNVLKLFVLPFGKNVVNVVHIQRSVIPSAALDVQVFVQLPAVGR